MAPGVLHADQIGTDCAGMTAGLSFFPLDMQATNA
jgi:hypothetical protein